MERNDNFGSTGGMGENTGSGSFGSSGSGFGNSGSTSGSAGYGSGSSAADTPSTGYGADAGLGGSAYGAGGASYASTGTQAGEGRVADAKEKLGSAKDAAADKLSSARDVAGEKLGALKEKASNLSATLADKLEAGAEKLRGQQGGAVAFAGGAGAAGATAGTQDERMAAINNRLAGGMQGAADWLREGDLRATVEREVRENPGRTLLIALGVGYLLGKALRK
jgi:ElaB/YqjD/DUF883 family membrane-anchored ribosome-binding protein